MQRGRRWKAYLDGGVLVGGERVDLGSEVADPLELLPARARRVVAERLDRIAHDLHHERLVSGQDVLEEATVARLVQGGLLALLVLATLRLVDRKDARLQTQQTSRTQTADSDGL